MSLFQSTISSETGSSSSPKVVIIRGPSGSGKSTVSAALLRQLREANNQVCYFDMDYFRLTIPGDNIHGKESARIASAMLSASIAAAIKEGFHVVLEGLLSKRSFGEMINKLQAEHSVKKFYLRIPFEETVRRHSTRDKRDKFGEAEMKGWYPDMNSEISDDDIIIEQSSSVEDSIALIRRTIEL